MIPILFILSNKTSFFAIKKNNMIVLEIAKKIRSNQKDYFGKFKIKGYYYLNKNNNNLGCVEKKINFKIEFVSNNIN